MRIQRLEAEHTPVPVSFGAPPQPGHGMLKPFFQALFLVLQKAQLGDTKRDTALLLVRRCDMQCYVAEEKAWMKALSAWIQASRLLGRCMAQGRLPQGCLLATGCVHAGR